MAKKKTEVKTEENNKKSSSFQLGLTLSLAVLLVVLCTIMLTKEISGVIEQRKIMDKFNEYYQSDELSIIFYSAEGCGFCELQRPILDRIAKDYGLEYLDLEKTKLSESQKKKVLEKLGIEDATPATVVVSKGAVVARQIGYVQGNKYVDFFVESGVLKEDSKYIPEKHLTFIGYEEFEKLRTSTQPVAVVIGTATCENCTMARPILSNLSNAYDVPIYYMTLDYIGSDSRISLVADLESMKFNEETFVEEGQLHTPTLLIIKNNKVVDYAIGLGNITSYTKLFKDNAVIEE